MLSTSLSGRARAQSHANIRKKIIRPKSEDKQERSKNQTAINFRPKLQRLLQQGKIQQIMNTDPHTKADLYYTTHINQLEKELGSAKKALGTMVMKAKAKEYNINILKNDIQKTERESSIIQVQNVQSQNKLNEEKNLLHQKKIDLETQIWKQKSYANMKQRLIKEEEYYKARYEMKSVEHKNILDQTVVLQKKYYELCQLNKQLVSSLSRAKKISREQAVDKSQYISLLNEEMLEKDMLNDLKIEKNLKDEEINNISPSLIQKEELKKFKDILFTHRILDQIVKVKNQNLMKRYEKVQKAYMHIKSNTNIHQLQKIVKRMEDQDAQYERLLKKVSKLQQQLLTMQSKMEYQNQKQRQLLSMEGQGRDLRKQTYQGIQKDTYELLVLQKIKEVSRRREDEILKKKIIIWVNQYAHLYGIQMGKQEDFFSKLTQLGASMKKSR